MCLVCFNHRHSPESSPSIEKGRDQQGSVLCNVPGMSNVDRTTEPQVLQNSGLLRVVPASKSMNVRGVFEPGLS